MAQTDPQPGAAPLPRGAADRVTWSPPLPQPLTDGRSISTASLTDRPAKCPPSHCGRRELPGMNNRRCSLSGLSRYFPINWSTPAAPQHRDTQGTILHPAQFTFYIDACIVASLNLAQSWFSPAANSFHYTCALRGVLAKAELCSGANDTWCYFCDRKINFATDQKISVLSALASSAIGVAILTYYGSSELQHKLPHQ